MNSLHRDIKVGEEVVFRKDLFKKRYQPIKFRVFICESGFGMSGNTRGTAIFGKFKIDGEECRWDGDEIDVDETIKYQEGLENGKSSRFGFLVSIAPTKLMKKFQHTIQKGLHILYYNFFADAPVGNTIKQYLEDENADTV